MRKSLFKKCSPLLFLCFCISCNTTNWKENFKEKEKSPFGTYIFYNEAQNIFPNQEIITLKKNIYDYLFLNSVANPTKLKNYVLIKSSAYKLTDIGIDALVDFASEGNTVFMSLNTMPQQLAEKLNFTTNNLNATTYSIPDLKKLTGSVTLENPIFDKTYQYDRNIRKNYFLEFDENNTSVLGNIIVDGEKVANFIKVYHGKGFFYLHLQPIVFTNYNLLKNKTKYPENILSYLPENKILWDSHIKSSMYKNQEDTSSVFKFFLEHQTLTWFLIVALIGVLLFLLFNARRKQRPIPEVKPLENSTVAFTQTIANLYLKEENHKNLIDKKIAFFLEKVRTQYLLDTSNLNTIFIEKLAAKSGNKIQQTKYLINTIKALDKKLICSEEELIVLHKMIKNFFKK